MCNHYLFTSFGNWRREGKTSVGSVRGVLILIGNDLLSDLELKYGWNR